MKELKEIAEKLKRSKELVKEADEILNSVRPLFKPLMDFLECEYLTNIYYDEVKNSVIVYYQDWNEPYDDDDRTRANRVSMDYFTDPKAYVSKLVEEKRLAEEKRERERMKDRLEQKRKDDLAEFERLKKELFPDENSDCRPDLY